MHLKLPIGLQPFGDVAPTGTVIGQQLDVRAVAIEARSGKAFFGSSFLALFLDGAEFIAELFGGNGQRLMHAVWGQ